MFPYNDPSMSNQEDPLLARMSEHLPGFFAAAGFNINRGANTIMRGGYHDEVRRPNRRKYNKYRTVQNGQITGMNKRQYFGKGRTPFSSGRAGAKMAAGEVGTASGRIRNNVFTRPRNFTRLNTLTALTDQSYTPFQGAKFVGKSEKVKKAFGKLGVKTEAGESALGAGVFSFITAGRKADRLEAKMLKRRAGGSDISGRLAKKLAKVDSNITSLARINNPAIANTPGMARSFIDDAMRSGVKAKGGIGVADAGTRGVRGNLMASSVGGGGSRFMAGYARGALGFGKVGGLSGEAKRGAQMARVHMAKALRSAGIVEKSGMKLAGEALEKGVFKTLGVKGTLKTFGTSAGAKVLGARAAAMAIPGLNVVAAASMVYDIGKMAGEVVKSGINLARDATTSLKGSINKPLFGMGYKDTEAAATSRARGVMAIQNSRLNARSALGSEASMMAAHFG